MEGAEKKMDEKYPMRIAERRFKGILMWQCEAEEFETMETRADDIWICTFPRSGTTMTIQLVYLIQTLDFETANNVQLEVRVPFLDCKDDRFPYYKGKKTIDEMKSPRMIKSHLHHFLLPEQLRKGKGRIIYMYRNPKDAVISLFKLFKWTHQLDEGDNMFGRFFDSFVDGTAYACPWPQHVLGYWEKKDEPQVLFLRFEDVVKDMPAAIRRIATFLGRTLTNKDVANIAENCSIEKMRNNKEVNYSYWQDIGYVDCKPGESHFINKGQPGTWHEELTQEQIAKMDKLIKEVEDAGVTVVHT
ncbi:amine sulfotransferase-like [Ruditapes philippinarum]|uniref:amine sulfotransferase-like n=1 Tax=Ruditapes philippinarum TaxID=129788 RepID=UPI00295AF83F|nr:amine sulfotransferase-like [Ruditapes philippinarum]